MVNEPHKRTECSREHGFDFRGTDSWPGYLPPGGSHKGPFPKEAEVSTKKKKKILITPYQNHLNKHAVAKFRFPNCSYDNFISVQQ